MCSTIIDLNRGGACHREFLRLRVRLAQTNDVLDASSVFPDTLPSNCRASPLSRCSFDYQVDSYCS